MELLAIIVFTFVLSYIYLILGLAIAEFGSNVCEIKTGYRLKPFKALLYILFWPVLIVGWFFIGFLKAVYHFHYETYKTLRYLFGGDK